jgi:DNA-binding Xre family transcriptional regulator
MVIVKNISTSQIIFANNVDLRRKVCYTFSILYFKYLRCKMAASYKKLFKLMIDREIKSKDLAAKAGISPTTLAKMKKDGATVSSDVLVKICTALDCKLDDIVEIVPAQNNK